MQTGTKLRFDQSEGCIEYLDWKFNQSTYKAIGNACDLLFCDSRSQTFQRWDRQTDGGSVNRIKSCKQTSVITKQ